MASTLHTLNDGSSLQLLSARALTGVRVWKGNRIIDGAHVKQIQETVGENVRLLDFGYRIVRYEVEDAGGATIQETVLVDGQHRHAVLCDYFRGALFADDFPVIVTIKDVESEVDIIEYFNTLNNVKAITWSDPNLVANAYLKALETQFNKPRALNIRQGATHRPYLSAEKIREELLKVAGLRGGKADIETFIHKVVRWNEEGLRTAEVAIALGGKNADMIAKAAAHKFMLALDPKLPWIRLCL